MVARWLLCNKRTDSFCDEKRTNHGRLFYDSWKKEGGKGPERGGDKTVYEEASGRCDMNKVSHKSIIASFCIKHWIHLSSIQVLISIVNAGCWKLEAHEKYRVVKVTYRIASTVTYTVRRAPAAFGMPHVSGHATSYCRPIQLLVREGGIIYPAVLYHWLLRPNHQRACLPFLQSYTSTLSLGCIVSRVSGRVSST